MIHFFTPDAQMTTRAGAVQLAYRFGMRTGTPFKPSNKIGREGNPSLEELKEIQGKEWLTSLRIEAQGKAFEFAECVISINQEKNIVTTALQGRNGTIKEYVSDGDYHITIDAGISNYKEENADIDYPLEAVKALKEVLELPQELAVQSDFLDAFKIETIVIKSFSLNQETHSNRQSINIQALSDKPYEIKLKES